MAGERGLTLVEVTIAMVVLLLTVVAGLTTMDTNTSAQKYLAIKADQEGRADRVIARVSSLLSEASAATLADVPNTPYTSNTIRFSRAVSYTFAAGVVLGPEERIHESSGAILLSTSALDTPLVSGNGSITFSREGDAIHVELAMEVAGPKGMPVQAKRKSLVYCRN